MGKITTSVMDRQTSAVVSLDLTGRCFVGGDGAFAGEYFVLPHGYAWPNNASPFPAPHAGLIEVPTCPGGANGWVWDFGAKVWIAPAPAPPPPAEPPTQSERIAALEAKVAALEGGSMTASTVKRAD